VQKLVTYAGRAAALALVSMLVACGGGTTIPEPIIPTTLPPPPPTPAPTPAPPATVTGFWLARAGNLAGYGIEVTQNGGTFRGRAVFPFRNVTGPTVGSVNGAAVKYDTDYGAGDSDSFDGVLDASRTRMTGTVSFQLRSIGYVVTFNDVTLERQP
jgi:hypothetical protein